MLCHVPALSFDSLDATEFEEFCFDLMVDMGYVNVDWRKGTGKTGSPADQGRDIVADEQRASPDGRSWMDRWFVDCKHYKSGVPPTELLNLITWAQAERPAVVLFCVSNYLSNGAKTWIADFEATMPPFRIVTWELPQLAALTEGRQNLLTKYSLDASRKGTQIAEAEVEFFERVWFKRKMDYLERMVSEPNLEDLSEDTYAAMETIRERYGDETLGPHSDFDFGMINGKLSALRWVLGAEWDELGT